MNYHQQIDVQREELLLRYRCYEHPGQSYRISRVFAGDFRVVERMLQTDAFVGQVLSTHRAAWEIPCTFKRYLTPRITPIGLQFYNLLQFLDVTLDQPYFEKGPYLKLFEEAVAQIEFTPHPMTGTAHSRPFVSGPSEGEFANAFVDAIRDHARKAKFKRRLSERKKDVQQQQRMAKKLLSSLASQTSNVFGQWITLEYQYSALNYEQTLAESDAHLDQFRDGLQDISTVLQTIGQIWMRHYLPEIGFRIHMLLLYSQHDFSPHAERYGLLEHIWKETTNARGIFKLDSTLIGSSQIELMLKTHAQLEMIVRPLQRSPNDFGCFDYSARCRATGVALSLPEMEYARGVSWPFKRIQNNI